MGKHRGNASVLIICMLFIFVFVSGAERQEKPEQKQEDEDKPSIFQVVKGLFNDYSSSPIRVRSYWDKVKATISPVQSYFFPPNLDFRVRPEAADGGEKVKGAAAKSIEKSKATVEETVEESAKSAAEIAGKTMQKTKDKVKKSFSQSEL